MIRTAPLLAVTAALITACGPQQPPSRATAQRLCVPEARQADGISGVVGIGGGSEGVSTTGGLRITSDILNPRNEQEAFEECVTRRLNGQPNPQNRGVTVGLTLGGST